jgi:catechol 2,3-dioxygenase-like lactoylglutathione lyase family enzyme
MSVRVEALDHVNIITADLEGSARFYAEVFGLEPRDGPPPLTHLNARWMYDAAGRAVLHINSLDCPRTYEREVRPGPTGALHHVALRCSGYEELRARLGSRGLAHQLNEVAAVSLKQIFVLDPNGVLLELNFFGA